jgi:hypothetical protein
MRERKERREMENVTGGKGRREGTEEYGRQVGR